MDTMNATAESEITPQRRAIPEEAAYLDLVRTAEALSRPVVQLLKTEELSSAQYNVLRILRGSPNGLTCGEIGERMITRDPDITRLLDRMEKRGVISRSRDIKDRRVVLTRITTEGLDVLARLDQPVRDLHRRLLGHLGGDRLRTLRHLLEACRSEVAMV
jgi:DNA-binding MarR family transcriptional regulator